MQVVRLAAVALAVLGASVVMPGARQQVDVSTLGPQPGQKAIEFRLPDQQGRERTLASVAGPKGTMLVFFRSADW